MKLYKYFYFLSIHYTDHVSFWNFGLVYVLPTENFGPSQTVQIQVVLLYYKPLQFITLFISRISINMY